MKNKKFNSTLILFSLPLLFSPFANAQTLKGPDVSAPAAPPGRTALGMSPSIMEQGCAEGQSVTIPYEVSNGTESPFHFTVDVVDAVVRDGKRTFVEPGITEGGIAATAKASPVEFDVAPGQQGRSSVTFTMPIGSQQREAVVYFRGKPPSLEDKNQPNVQISLGALIICKVGNQLSFKVDVFRYDPQSDSANVSVSYELTNTGAEPVSPKGTMALLNSSGKLVGRSQFEPRQLLPGQRDVFRASSTAVLPPGRYRVVSVFDYGGVSTNGSVEVLVPSSGCR
jgi:hypothetical protein